jgi:DNA polymerase-1
VRLEPDLTGDPLLCRLFNEGADVYSETASRLFDIPLDQVDRMRHRDPAKRITLGTLYGLQGEGLLTQLLMAGITGYDLRDCDKMQEGWFEVYPGVRRYIVEVMTPQLERDGYVRDHGGMYRYLPGVWSRDKAVRAEAIRIALSHQVSGGAQTMIQDSMPWIWRRIVGLRKADYDTRMRLQFHDELIASCPEEHADDVMDVMVEGLTKHCGLELDVPVLASGQAGRSWVELK